MARTVPVIRCPSSEMAGRGAAGAPVPAGREDADYETEGGRPESKVVVVSGAGSSLAIGETVIDSSNDSRTVGDSI